MDIVGHVRSNLLKRKQMEEREREREEFDLRKHVDSLVLIIILRRNLIYALTGILCMRKPFSHLTLLLYISE